jgi:hypothetical protein
VSEVKFSPGPWTLTEFDQGFIVSDNNGELVETVYSGAANALLMKAAPDLYSALDRIASSMEVIPWEHRSPREDAYIKIARDELAKVLKP